MTPDTVKMPIAPRHIAPLEPDDERWLRSLAPHYARKLEGAIDVTGLVARARRLALDRGADVLEQVDLQRARLLADRSDALALLNPDERTLVLRRAQDLLKLIDHLPKLAGFEEAASWMGGLSSEVARALAMVVVIEQRLEPIEELRRRAYHSLEALVKRSDEASTSAGKGMNDGERSS